MISRSVRFAVAVALVCVVAPGCTDDGDEASADPTEHASRVAELADLLPEDARGVFAADLESLLAGASAKTTTTRLSGEAADPALAEPLGAIGTLADQVDVAGEITTAMLVQTTDAADGTLLLATVRGDAVEDVVDGSVPPTVAASGSSQDLYDAGDGNVLTLLSGGRLVVGTPAAVASVVEVADGDAPEGSSAIAPFADEVVGEAPVSFAYGLPALFDDDIEPDLTLRGADVLSGELEIVDGAVEGALAFHTPNASTFVDDYNRLNRNAAEGEDPSEEPLTVADPVVGDLDQVVVALPPYAVDGSGDDGVAARNIVKKLFVGMEAHDYAEGVGALEEEPLVDLLVKSEQDDDTPPSPGSVFIRWEFRDQAAVEEFERNELPEGFTLARTRFLDSDDPEGEYFLALNLYNSSGSIVSGARAEWDVFVNPPEGADPDAGVRPRFMIIDALAEAVSADPIHLVTEAEPLSHAFDGDVVKTTVRRTEGDAEVPVFQSSFPKPDPETAEVARFTREMAIGNDYIYWANGVYDRVVYNATTFNEDAYFVDPATVTITDDTRWRQYLKPEVTDVTYYVNTLEYVASPMANLDSDHLDVTPEWLEQLTTFKDNGHQAGLMRGAVDQLFLGEGDALVDMRIANETPSTFTSFEITDPEGLEATLDLPSGHHLVPTALVEGGDEAHYLTLSVYEEEGSTEGTRAEWSVYVDDGTGRRYQVVLDAMTEDVALDPVSLIGLPGDVRHELDEGVVRTRLSSPEISYDASFATEGTTDEELTLDWIESGDEVCSRNGICDLRFYDAETLDVPVHRPAEVKVEERSTPWDEFLAEEPAMVFFRDNAQQYAVKRWHNLAVPVEELPVGGLEDPTHVISGSGALDGRTTDVVDSAYTYTGDAVVEDGELTFSIDQEVVNALGTSHIFTTGTFDLESGTGTQTVVDCRGPDLMCGDIERGSSALFTAQDLDASDPDAITWKVDLVIDIGGNFGTADSTSTFTATSAD